MANVAFDLPTAGAPTASLSFKPTFVEITRKHTAPIQNIEVAINGEVYVRTLSSNVEETWQIDFNLLHEADDGANSGYAALKGFIESSSTGSRYSANSFEVTDADGDTLIGRYIRGLESFVEGGARAPGKAGRFSGFLIFQKEI
jgi:hypothetical protein